MTVISAHLAKDLSILLTEGHAVDIRGFGQFKVRVYEAYEGRNPRTGERIQVPEQRLCVLKVAEELRDYLNGKRHTVSIAGCELLSDRTAARLGVSAEQATRAWTRSLHELLERVVLAPVVFGELGVFRAPRKAQRMACHPQTGEMITVAARTVLSFRPSRRLKDQLNGKPEAPTLNLEQVDKAIAGFSASPVVSAAELAQRLSALGATLAAPSETVGMLAGRLGREMPELLQRLFSYEIPEVASRALTILSQPSELSDVLGSFHLDDADADELIVPFAGQGGEYWSLCPHPAPADDIWVFPMYRHAHDLLFTQWLSGSLFVWDLARLAGNEHMLSPMDMERVLGGISKVADDGSFDQALPF